MKTQKPVVITFSVLLAGIFAMGVTPSVVAQVPYTLRSILNNPGPAEGDNAGVAIAISGTRAVVGANLDDTVAENAGIAYIYDFAGATPSVPVLTLNNPSPAPGGGFGRAVAISGSVVVVGAGGQGPPSPAGRAYVYDLTSATPSVPVLTLVNPNPAGFSFGAAVAVSGTRIVIGAPSEGAGTAYVYDLVDPFPTVPLATLNNPTPGADRFGHSVSVSGAWAVISAPWDDAMQPDNGTVYVYDLASPMLGTPVMTLNNPSPALYDLFGFSVGVSGTRVVVADIRGVDIGPTEPGSVYVYDLISLTPTVPVMTLNNPDEPGPAADYFAYSVAISGTRVVVSAPQHEVDASGQAGPGITYIYELASAEPGVPIAALNNPSPALNDRFGHSVAVDGTSILVGAPSDDTGASDAGTAYWYDVTPSNAPPAITWIQPTNGTTFPAGTNIAMSARATDPDGSVSYVDFFANSMNLGRAVSTTDVYELTWSNAPAGTFELHAEAVDDRGARAISDSVVIVIAGAPPNPPSPPVLSHSLFNPATHAQAGVHQGYSVAMDGNFVVVGIPGAAGADNVQDRNTGAVKVYDATTGALLHTLKNPTPPPPPKAPGPPDFYPDGYDKFGHCVAIAGTLIVVGAPYANVPEVRTGGRIDPYAAHRDAGLVYIYDLAGPNPAEPVAALNSPEPNGEQLFGYSVAIYGRDLVVGAPNDNAWTGGAYEWGKGPGSIHIYALTHVPTAIPVLLDTISNPNPSRNYYFGYSVALSGAAAAVGAPFGVGGTNSGTVYLYDIGDHFARSVPVAVLTNPNPTANDGFGASIAISSARVLVGTPYDDTVALDAGNAYVYEYSLDRITPTVLAGTLTSPAPAASELFAYSVSASGDLLAVGTYSGESAYIYDFASLTPSSPAATLSNPTPATDDRFGYSVAVSGTRVLVGAPYDDTQALDAGSAYLFDLAGPAPTTAVGTLDDPILGTGGNAGKSVAVSGNTVVVAAANETYVYDLTSSTPATPLITLNAGGGGVAVAGTLLVVGVPSDNGGGTTHVYDLANAAPTEPIIILTNPAAAGSFGSSVAISGTQIAVGAPFNPFIGGGPGSVYVYDLLSVTPALPVVTLNNPVGHPSFGWSVSLAATRVVVGVPTEGRGRAYVYHLASVTPAVPVITLDNPPSSTHNQYFGWSVSLSGTRFVVGAPQGDNSVGSPGTELEFAL